MSVLLPIECTRWLNSFKPNGISHCYHLDQSIFILRVVFYIFMEHSVCKQWRGDQMPHSAASGLGLHCLPMSHKKEARLIWINP